MAAKKEIKKVEPLKFTDAEGNELTLMITRATVMKMSRDKFTDDNLMMRMSEDPIGSTVKLVWYSLLANRPDATMEEAEDLLFSVGLNTLSEPLFDMYKYAYETLMTGEGKNAKWRMA